MRKVDYNLLNKVEDYICPQRYKPERQEASKAAVRFHITTQNYVANRPVMQ